MTFIQDFSRAGITKINKKQYSLLFILCFLISLPSFAAGEDYWICKAHDATQKEWVVQNTYQRMAINLAFDACKKQSTSPLTCNTSNNSCEGFIDGVSTKPLWLCLALDANATPWRSNYYTNKEDAALAAKAYCKSKSELPETCYVNMITCNNINQ